MKKKFKPIRIVLPKLSKDVEFTADSICKKQLQRLPSKVQPNIDIDTNLRKILTKHTKSPQNFSLSKPDLKFSVLTECEKVFEIKFENSAVNSIKNSSDLKDYLSKLTPQAETDDNPLLELVKSGLPTNVTVDTEILKFDPLTDKLFDGKSAYHDRVFNHMTLKGKKRDIERPKIEPEYEFELIV